MRKKKLTAGERNIRVNEQRFAMTIILCNLLEAENGVSMSIKSATAASLINMMEMSMIEGDDDVFKELINNAIDQFCYEVETKHDVENYRERLMQSVKQARGIVDEMKAKIERIQDGEDILKNICLN
jgi:septation ring formation regulator EzrA